MGMPTQSVALLLMEHRKEPFVGPVLTYGMQHTNVPFGGALWMFEHLGIVPDRAGLDDPPEPGATIDFSRIVRMLGLGTPQVLDLSAYEGADFVADLNEPIPAELRGRFGLVLDGGTIEHVFDIRQAMKNTVDLLRVGGRAVHITPCNNYVNHGFFQVSPTFYHDYYLANGFEDPRGVLVIHPRDDVYTQKWNLVNYDHDMMGGANSMFCADTTQIAIYFTARKTATSTSDNVPTQSFVTRMHAREGSILHQFTVAHDETNPVFAVLPTYAAPPKWRAVGEIVNF